MMHSTRRWVIAPVASIEDLARMLTQRTWTLCSGFYVEGHPETIFLNDATHEDGAAEFGAARRLSRPRYWQAIQESCLPCECVAARRSHVIVSRGLQALASHSSRPWNPAQFRRACPSRLSINT